MNNSLEIGVPRISKAPFCLVCECLQPDQPHVANECINKDTFYSFHTNSISAYNVVISLNHDYPNTKYHILKFKRSDLQEATS